MRWFAGGEIGSVYSDTEIKRIRGFCRGEAKKTGGPLEDVKAYIRGVEILRAWATWRGESEVAEAHANFDAADSAQTQAHDEGELLAKQLALLPVSTLDGLLAKAAALQDHLRPIEAMADDIRNDMLLYDIDNDVLALSLARDILVLASGKEAAQ
jgi:hypothetical protein